LGIFQVPQNLKTRYGSWVAVPRAMCPCRAWLVSSHCPTVTHQGRSPQCLAVQSMIGPKYKSGPICLIIWLASSTVLPYWGSWRSWTVACQSRKKLCSRVAQESSIGVRGELHVPPHEHDGNAALLGRAGGFLTQVRSKPPVGLPQTLASRNHPGLVGLRLQV